MDDRLARLARLLPRLDAAADSVSELVSAAPELACELGFDRVMISRVQDGVWYPELMFIRGGDPAWAAEITAAGNTRPSLLEAGTPETEMVATGRPIVVNNVRGSAHPRSGQQAMIKASGTRSYVAAPIVSGDQVVGMLHADCHTTRRVVDETDRDVLAAFSAGLRLVLARCVLHDELEAIRQRLAGLSVELRDFSGSIDQMPVVRVVRPDDGSTDDMLVKVGPSDGASDPLPDSLTARELEVLKLLAAGCTNTAIAHRLVIAEGTAKKHVFHVLRKLHVSNRAEAVARWYRSRESASTPLLTSEYGPRRS